MTSLSDCVQYLDRTLATAEVPDYDRALNGLQLANDGSVTRVATAVDFSHDAVREAVEAGANLLIVHHGMFWGGAQPITGVRYTRLQAAFRGNLAVYSSHLPLDLHAELGNNALLARRLNLVPDAGFGRFRDIEIGVTGSAECSTQELLDRVRSFAQPLGSPVVHTPIDTGRRTERWALVTGAGASSDTLQEAQDRGIDTLVVGEGPQHTAVEARERGIVVVYAGHYATETLGVQALGQALEREFSLPWSFIHLPTGL